MASEKKRESIRNWEKKAHLLSMLILSNICVGGGETKNLRKKRRRSNWAVVLLLKEKFFDPFKCDYL